MADLWTVQPDQQSWKHPVLGTILMVEVPQLTGGVAVRFDLHDFRGDYVERFQHLHEAKIYAWRHLRHAPVPWYQQRPA